MDRKNQNEVIWCKPKVALQKFVDVFFRMCGNKFPLGIPL